MKQWVLALSLFFSAVSTAAAPPPETLRLWHAYRGAEEDALMSSVRLFTKETGIAVEPLALPYDAFASKLTNGIPHGNGPDVFIFNHERLRNFEHQGLLVSSDGVIDAKAYFPNAVDALQVSGKTYGYPLSLKSLALIINTRLVPVVPSDTRTWVTQMRAISNIAENRYGLAYESGDFYLHAPFLFGFGGELFYPDGRARFDSPGMSGSLAFVKGLQDEHLIPTEASGALVKSLFNDGRVGAVISGPWFVGEIDKAISYRVVRLPFVSETGKPMQPFLGVEAAFVAAHTEHEADAQKLARFLSVGEASVIRAKVGRQVPANVDAYTHPEVRDDPLIASFREAATYATPMPNTLEMAKVWEPMKLALRGVLQGATLPQDAGALADRRYRALNREKPPHANPIPYIIALVLAAVGAVVYVARKSRSTFSFRHRYPDTARALAYVAPATVGLLVLVAVPFTIGIGLAFFHHDAGHYTFVGLANFVDILASRGYRIAEPLSFYFTLAVTILWAFVNVTLHVSIGLGLALLLKDPLLKLRGIFRVLLIVPWAVPNYITAMMWKGMFHRQFGAINGLLVALHLQPISWFTRWSTSFAANVATNTWLGFPFMMVVALGALQSIPQDLYEAAEVDGASKWTQFKRITLPLLRPALLPSVILGTVWTFNMFNIIYLVSGGEPGGSTDILVSEAFRWAFQRNEQYGFAAAYSVLIFFVLYGYSALTKRLTRDSAEVLQ